MTTFPLVLFCLVVDMRVDTPEEINYTVISLGMIYVVS